MHCMHVGQGMQFPNVGQIVKPIKPVQRVCNIYIVRTYLNPVQGEIEVMERRLSQNGKRISSLG